MLDKTPFATTRYVLAHAHGCSRMRMLHAMSMPCMLLQDAACAFEDASLRRIGALRHPWPEPMTCPHLLGIILAPEAPAPLGGPVAPVWCPRPAPASAAAHAPRPAEPVRDNAPEDFEGAFWRGALPLASRARQARRWRRPRPKPGRAGWWPPCVPCCWGQTG